jgi:hypothetical protein
MRHPSVFIVSLFIDSIRTDISLLQSSCQKDPHLMLRVDLAVLMPSSV